MCGNLCCLSTEPARLSGQHWSEAHVIGGQCQAARAHAAVVSAAAVRVPRVLKKATARRGVPLLCGAVRSLATLRTGSALRYARQPPDRTACTGQR
jgi:hypothetical protein